MRRFALWFTAILLVSAVVWVPGQTSASSRPIFNLQTSTPPLITSSPPTNAQYGQAYSYTLVATGSPAPTFTLASGTLPAGLTLGSGGLISGTPSETGSFAITIIASNGIFPNDAVNYTLVVQPAPLAITAQAQSRAYGTPNPTLTYDAVGLVLTDTVATALTGVLTTTATLSSPVGSYAITQGSLSSSANYTISFTSDTLSITPAPLTVTADAQSRMYGTANPTLTYSTTGLVLTDTVAAVLTGTLTTSATLSSSVGSYAITQGGLSSSANYSIGFTSALLSITPAPLTVTVAAQSRVYGTANPTLTYSATGFVLTDTVATALTGALTTTATTSSPVGSYAITQGSLAAQNYSLSLSSANLSITPAPLTITAQAQSRAYGVANPTLTYTATGLVVSDTVASALTGALTTTATLSSPVGSYAIAQGSLSAQNYSLSFSGANLGVTPAPLTITANAQSRAYGADNPPLTYGATGFVLTDTATTILTGTLATSATLSSPVGSYAITQGSLQSTANYTIAFTSGSLSITPLPLVVTAEPQIRSYGAPDPPLTFTATGLILGDTVATALSGALTTSTQATSPVGSYAITQGSLTAQNYTITFISAGLNITPALLTVTADNQSRRYGEDNPTLTYTITGFMNGEQSSVLTSLPVVTTTATLASPVGSYPITASGGSARNYRFTYLDGILSISPAVQNSCAGSTLRGLLRGSGPRIELDGSCRYQLTETTGSNGHLINLFSRTDLTIDGNGATIEGSGALGLLTVIDSTNVTISDLTLIGGRANGPGSAFAGRGGALMLYNSSVTLDRIRLIDNQATLGGALSTVGGTTTVINSLFADNQAGEIGSAILAQGPIQVSYSTIAAQSFHPGVALLAWDDATVETSIMANHAVGIAAAGGTTQSVSEEYNLFAEVGEPHRTYNVGSQIIQGVHSLNASSAAAQFNDPATYDYRLRPDSVAIDQAPVPTGAATSDADGLPRPFGSSYADLGAYELQIDQSLQVRKLVPRWVAPNEPFTVQLIVTNRGRGTWQDLELRDTLPPELSLVGEPAQGGRLEVDTLIWDLAAIQPGQSLTYSYQAAASASTVSDNYSLLLTADRRVVARGPQVAITTTVGIVAALRDAQGRIFSPARDGLSFANWADPTPEARLPNSSIYYLFGPEVCAQETAESATSCVPTATGLRQALRLQQAIGRGRAFGMVALSLKLFRGDPLADGSLSVSDLQPGATSSSVLERTSTIEQMIDLYQATRITLDRENGEAQASDGTAADLVRLLLDGGLSGSDGTAAYTLQIRHADGHSTTLLPYALEQYVGSNYGLYVYDPNAPGDSSRLISLDSSTNRWSYSAGGSPAVVYSGDSLSRNLVLRHLSVDGDLPRSCSFCSSALDPTQPSLPLTMMLNGSGRMVVTGSSGGAVAVDSVGGTYSNTLAGAWIDEPGTGPGSGLAPLVRVPAGSSYQVMVQGISTISSTVELTISAPGMSAEVTELLLTGPTDAITLTIDHRTRKISLFSEYTTFSRVTTTSSHETENGNSYSITSTAFELTPSSIIDVGFDATTEQLQVSSRNRTAASSNSTPGVLSTAAEGLRYNLALTRVAPGGLTQSQQRENITLDSGTASLLDLGEWDGEEWPPTTIVPYQTIWIPVIAR